MDHHHQWRPRPFQTTSNICPVCSTPHLPFCPPHPQFNQNPRFPSAPNQAIHTLSNFNPYPYRNPGTPLAHGYPGNPNSSGGEFGACDGNGYVGAYDYDCSGDDRSRKRARIDDTGSGSFGNGQHQKNVYLSEFGAEERRLKLIYDHGGGASGSGNQIQFKQMNSMGFGGHGAANPPGLPPGIDRMPNHVQDSNWRGHVAPEYAHNVRGSSISPVGQRNFAVLQRFKSPPSNMVPLGFRGVPHPSPASPQPPLPMESPGHYPFEHRNMVQSYPMAPSSFPVHAAGSPSMVSPSYPPLPREAHSGPPFVNHGIQYPILAGHAVEEPHALQQTMYNQYGWEDQSSMSKQWTSDKPKVIDAVQLFRQPHRATRPDHIVIILRGLPGSGKSYIAKILRDIEVENGCQAPRIHSMDDYFMTEVEKAEDCDNSKSARSSKVKKSTMKIVMEYCYEPEMEEAYRASMLKAFKKSLEDGGFTFIIVDDRNLRVADFAQFWAIAKRSGYEVYLLEAPYKDPVGCAARNLHNFTKDDIQKMAGKWEEAPSLYLQLDAKSLFHGDNLKETGIEEVDMDMEDEVSPELPGTGGIKEEAKTLNNSSPHEYEEPGNASEIAKELVRSKWLDELDEEDAERKCNEKRKADAHSGWTVSYSKKTKSVHWGDQAKDTGFSIGAAKKASQSLVIGPGPGYNSTSNPMLYEDKLSSVHKNGNKQTVFRERQRAEHESFKVVFAKRKQKLGFVLEDE